MIPRSIRAKSVLAALIPMALILVVVAVLGLYALDQVARDVVRDRDEDFARVTAARLSERLELPTRLLGEAALDEGLRSGDPDRAALALADSLSSLFVFDGGVIVYDRNGIAQRSVPANLIGVPEWRTFPEPEQLDQVAATLRPAFSPVFRDPTTDEDVVIVAVPILDPENEFNGALAGMLTLRLSLLSTLFADVLAARPGEEGVPSQSVLLVDGRGRVVYHTDPGRIGDRLTSFDPVARVIAGEVGAEITREEGAEEVIAGFAPVPGTGWGVVTQDSWDSVLAPIRAASRLLLWLVGIGGVLSAALVFLAVRQALQPIQELTLGAERLGGGDFETPIDMDTDAELRPLAVQFNAMARSLAELYADLERRVELRTRENRRLYLQAQERAQQLAALNLRAASVADVATRVSSVLALDELLPSVTELLHQRFGYYHVDIHLFEEGGAGLLLRASSGAGSGPSRLREAVPAGRGVVGWVAEHGEAVVANDVAQEPRFTPHESLPETRAELAVPIAAGAEVLGVLNVESSTVDAFDERDRFTLRTLADQLAVAIENARLFEQTRDVAVLEERTRMAREIHDTLAQGFTGIVLQLEAADQASEAGAKGLPALHEHLERAKELARASLQEARRTVWDLMPRALEGRTLDAAIAAEVREFGSAGREQAAFALDGSPRELPSNVQAALLRVCQESLTNVRRHAGASRVAVRLAYRPREVQLEVEDDGAGFDVTEARSRGRGGGFGLSGMQQRVEQIGGRLTFRRGSAGGTLVEAVIPAP